MQNQVTMTQFFFKKIGIYFLNIYSFLKKRGQTILKNKYGTFWGLLIITGFAAFLRGMMHYLEPVLSRDAFYYMECAELLKKQGMAGVLSELPRFSIPLLYPVLLNAISSIGCSYETAGLLISFLTGCALIPLVYGCTVLVFENRTAGFAAALFAATHWAMVEFSKDMLRENLMLFLIAVSIFFACYAERKKWALGWLCAGFFSIISCFARYEAWEIIFLAFFYFSFQISFNKKDVSVLLRKVLYYILGLILGAVFLYFIFQQPFEFYQNHYFSRIPSFL